MSKKSSSPRKSTPTKITEEEFMKLHRRAIDSASSFTSLLEAGNVHMALQAAHELLPQIDRIIELLEPRKHLPDHSEPLEEWRRQRIRIKQDVSNLERQLLKGSG